MSSFLLLTWLFLRNFFEFLLLWFFDCLLTQKFLILTIFQFWFQVLPEFPTVLLNFQKRITSLLGSNQSILKEINPEYSLEGLMLKLQYFGHQRQRADSLEKTLILGRVKCKKRQGWQRMRWLEGNHCFKGREFAQTLRDGEGQGILGCCSQWDWRVGNNCVTEQQQWRQQEISGSSSEARSKAKVMKSL